MARVITTLMGSDQEIPTRIHSVTTAAGVASQTHMVRAARDVLSTAPEAVLFPAQ